MHNEHAYSGVRSLLSNSGSAFPRISIIIPCFYQANYLEDCLISIREQTLGGWEAIVVDDASPDGDQIRNIIDSLSDNRIKLVRHHRNSGLAASRNTGARHATADLLVFVDADDLLAPDFCKVMVALFKQNPDLDVAYSHFEVFGDESGIDPTRGSKTELEHKLRFWIRGAGSVMRRSVWERIGGYCEDEILRAGMEDREFWIASIPLELSIVHVLLPLYRWRRYSGTMSRNMDAKRYQLHLFIANRHRATLKQLGVYRQFIADGYFRSARYFYAQGNRVQALCLAGMGLCYQPAHQRLRSLAFSSLIPSSASKMLSFFRKRAVL